MKKIIIAIITSLLLVSPVYALQQIAGELVIPVQPGESGSARYRLINDEEEVITVRLRAEGDVANFLSFSETVDLPPKEIIYTDITANIPVDYSGGDITGYIYALQEGEPGTVKINIQLKKAVRISVSGSPEGSVEAQTSPITGFVGLVSNYSPFIVIIIVLAIIVSMFLKIKRGKE
jgi:hypothetical protein